MVTIHIQMLLFLLIAGHALADFPLQGDYLSRAKNRTAPLPGTPWWIAMWAHGLIHGGVVALVLLQYFPASTVIGLAMAESSAHVLIDDAKCSGKIGYAVDQALHVACKILWVLILWCTA